MPGGGQARIALLFLDIAGKLRSARDQALSYNLTRAYSFGEATSWAVIISFILLLVPITFLNLATNGWDLQLAYTPDPNSTEARRAWFQSKFFVWGDDKLDSTCQRIELRPGDRILTTNFGMSYTVTYIKLRPYGQGAFQQYPSLSYKNNTLEDCHVDSMNIVLAKDGQGEAVKIEPGAMVPWWSWVLYVDGFVHCSITGENGLYQLGFTYRFQSDHGSYDYVAVNNATSQASIWWGTRILDSYVVGLRYLMTGLLPQLGSDTSPYTNAVMVFLPGNGTSIRGDKDFELQSYYFIQADGSITNIEPANPFNNIDWGISRPVTEGLFVAKAFSSLILTDVGNNRTANLFQDSSSLQYALNPGDDDFNRISGGPLNLSGPVFDKFRFSSLSPPTNSSLIDSTSVPLGEAYAAFSSQTGPLGTRPATVQANYICSIPTRKSLTTVIILVITADYVLMLGIWAVFKFFANIYAEKRVLHPTYCDGCLAQMDEHDHTDSMELRPQSYVAASSRQSLMEPRDEINGAYGPLQHA